MSSDLPITNEILKKAFHAGLLQFIRDPNLENGTVCRIGEYWFYFHGADAADMNPEEFLKNAELDDVIQRVCDALNNMWAAFEDEYKYYYAYLHEHLDVDGVPKKTMKKYYVTLDVWGTVTVSVEAESPKDAKKLANDIISDEDFGPLENIEWETVAVDDEKGNRVEVPE